MSSVLLGLTLLAVAWLSIWSVKDHAKPSKSWWMFAMRDAPEPPGKKPADDAGRAGGWRSSRAAGGPVQRPWRRSGS
jgi:hypothetical protein